MDKAQVLRLIVYYVYFIKSEINGKVYVGRTEKVPTIRLKEHNSGKNVWTKFNGPFKLIYYEKYHCLEDSVEREKFYKMGFGKMIKKVIIDTLERSGKTGIGAIG